MEPNSNISSLGELREMLRVAETLTEEVSKTTEVGLGVATFTDVNGEQVAELRYVSSMGYTLVFDGQKYSDA